MLIHNNDSNLSPLDPIASTTDADANAPVIPSALSPSHMTVYRILQLIIDRQEKAKSIRSPGWRGDRLSVKTRDGKDLSIEYSNQVWQCDHTEADILLVDSEGKLLARPWLTTVIDSYSRCIVGINLGYNAPSSQLIALALRHAILPKQYGEEYGLHKEWGTYGLPKHFYTDGGSDFKSNHLQQCDFKSFEV